MILTNKLSYVDTCVSFDYSPDQGDLPHPLLRCRLFSKQEARSVYGYNLKNFILHDGLNYIFFISLQEWLVNLAGLDYLQQSNNIHVLIILIYSLIEFVTDWSDGTTHPRSQWSVDTAGGQQCRPTSSSGWTNTSSHDGWCPASTVATDTGSPYIRVTGELCLIIMHYLMCSDL